MTCMDNMHKYNFCYCFEELELLNLPEDCDHGFVTELLLIKKSTKVASPAIQWYKIQLYKIH